MANSNRARALRKKSTWAEKLMWRWLRGRRFSGYKFRRQHPVGPYLLDFFCEEARLAIELDGGQHGFPEKQRHDSEREQFLSSRGIKVLRFWNSRLRREAQVVRDRIFCELQGRAAHPLPDYIRPERPGTGKSEGDVNPDRRPRLRDQTVGSNRFVK
jgi:very-short-patch-repair endonuclease